MPPTLEFLRGGPVLDKDILAGNRSRLDREQVQKLLVDAWLGRPEKERNQYAAERFVQQAAEEFEFESERPRTIVIRNWILPHILRVEEKDPSLFERWLNRPWFKRRYWPLRLAGLVFLVYSVFSIFWNLFTGTPEAAVLWIPVSAGAVFVLAILAVPRDPNR